AALGPDRQHQAAAQDQACPSSLAAAWPWYAARRIAPDLDLAVDLVGQRVARRDVWWRIGAGEQARRIRSRGQGAAMPLERMPNCDVRRRDGCRLGIVLKWHGSPQIGCCACFWIHTHE